MSDLIHNFAARKRKRDASFERAVNAIPGVAKGSSQSRSDEGSGGGGGGGGWGGGGRQLSSQVRLKWV